MNQRLSEGRWSLLSYDGSNKGALTSQILSAGASSDRDGRRERTREQPGYIP